MIQKFGVSQIFSNLQPSSAIISHGHWFHWVRSPGGWQQRGPVGCQDWADALLLHHEEHDGRLVREEVMSWMWVGNWKCWVNIPNQIAIFHRDNDQQNHWVQWGSTNYFQTYPCPDLAALSVTISPRFSLTHPTGTVHSVITLQEKAAFALHNFT